MKKSFIISTLIFLGAFLLASCTKEIEGQSNNNSEVEKEINFVTGINNLSRTVINEGSLRTDFVNKDAIGIFVYEGENAVAINVKYVYDGNKWNPENGDALTSKTGVQYKYYAYYPYKEGLKDPKNISISINADQTEDLTINDFLSAQNTTAAAGADNISLSFSHAFSLVQVGIKDKVAVDINEILMENVLPSSIIDITTGKTSATSGEAISVKMKKSTEKVEFRAIVPAQTITANNKLLTVIAADGKTYDVISKQNVSYIAGQALQITVNSLTPLPEGNEVTIGGSIADWDKGEDPGESNIDRVYTDLIPLKLKEIQESSFNILTSEPTPENYNESFWFAENRNENYSTKYYLTTDETYGNVIKIEYKGEGSWYNNFVGYYNPNKNNIIDKDKIYTLSFKAKIDKTENASKSPQIWTCIKLVKENIFCTIESATLENITTTKNLTFKNFTITENWATYSFNFKFSLLGDKSGSGSQCSKGIEWSSVNNFDYYINLAPRDVNTNYYITDVEFKEKE